MSDYDWDQQIEYLRKTRWLYYNDDYLEFLVQRVWKIDKPVHVVDYGCGYGYLGLKLLPLLPDGSTYTGLDKGEALINRAKEIFQHLPYSTEFRIHDIEQNEVSDVYDIAVSHAFLLHMPDPMSILQKMINSVKENGKVISFETHWIASMANALLDGTDQSRIVPLGNLQKLYEYDRSQTGKDGNIGMRIPAMMSQLGLKNVECRVSDRVNFLDRNMESSAKKALFESLKEEGLGQEPDADQMFMNALELRGLTASESQNQYRAELLFSQVFREDSWLAYAPNMKISFGTVHHPADNNIPYDDEPLTNEDIQAIREAQQESLEGKATNFEDIKHELLRRPPC